MSALERPPQGSSLPVSRAWTGIFFLAVLAGIGAFFWGISGPAALRAWQAYLVNFVYWTGLSCGAVLFVAVLNMTNAVWGRPLKRLAEALGAFLPVSFLLFCVLYFGKEEIFPWIRHPLPEKQFWLDPAFLFARNGIGLFLLSAASLALIYYSVKGDKKAIHPLPAPSGGVSSPESREDSCWKAQRVLSPIVGILYAFVLSLLAFDLIMSLDPHWYSTLFGAYYFMGSFYLGLSALYFISFLAQKAFGLGEIIHPHHLHDLGKLVFAFCIFIGYLFYVQFLVIWYGNLPEETRYVILRVKLTPWEPLAWAALIMIFAIPFGLLLLRKIKTAPLPMMMLCTVILAGMWVERFLLIAPSIWEGKGIPIGLLEILITAGFGGIMGLSVTSFLRRVPLWPVSDPLFRKAVEPHEEKEKP